MNEFCAIMGLCNLRYIDRAISKRKILYNYYIQCLENIKGIRLLESDSNIIRNYAYFPIFVEDDFTMNRNELYSYLRQNNIYARKYFYPLTSEEKCFKNKYKKADLVNAKKLADDVLVLPLYEELSLEVIERIAKLIKNHKSEIHI